MTPTVHKDTSASDLSCVCDLYVYGIRKQGAQVIDGHRLLLSGRLFQNVRIFLQLQLQVHVRPILLVDMLSVVSGRLVVASQQEHKQRTHREQEQEREVHPVQTRSHVVPRHSTLFGY